MDLDEIINKPFLTKNNSWYMYFTITAIIVIVMVYVNFLDQC